MLSRFEQNYIELTKSNPDLIHLVNQFDLTDPDGNSLPDVSSFEQIKFSLFWKKGDNSKNTHPLKEIGLFELADILKSDWLRDIPKLERPYITPYGTFSKRNNDSLIHFNRDLIALDYDKLDQDKLNYLRLYWKMQSNTLFCLVSPSGNGLKVIVRAKHQFTPEELHRGLKHNIGLFTISGIEPDHMQFVLSQPLFLPYSDPFYFNPHATIRDYPFEDLPEIEVIEPAIIEPVKADQIDRVNTFFKNRVDMCCIGLESHPRGEGTHSYIYSVVKRIYPYINQQTIYTENEITNRLESILYNRYGSHKRRAELHRTIEKGRYPEESLIDLINSTAKYPIK